MCGKTWNGMTVPTVSFKVKGRTQRRVHARAVSHGKLPGITRKGSKLMEMRDGFSFTIRTSMSASIVVLTPLVTE